VPVLSARRSPLANANLIVSLPHATMSLAPVQSEEKSPLQQRRARREERREKQRAANFGRAEKMHLERLAREQDALLARCQREPPAVNVGCSGWYYWHWREQFYADLPSSQWFEHYAGTFKTVELNAPFYSWPTVANVRSWLRQAGQRPFIYTVKVCELITHVKRFRGTRELVRDFGFVADLLGDRFGCFLFQLPPSFHYTPARLKAIVAQLEPARRNVVEFRHASWWNDRVYAAFRDAGVVFCSCSGPRLPDELINTTGEVYIRFHGTKQWYRHDYSEAELLAWAERLHASGARRVWAYFNNDRDAYSVKNAHEFERLLARRLPESVFSPERKTLLQ
jgi:uncharacterized protein YecE (DUF72 family)